MLLTIFVLLSVILKLIKSYKMYYQIIILLFVAITMSPAYTIIYAPLGFKAPFSRVCSTAMPR